MQHIEDRRPAEYQRWHTLYRPGERNPFTESRRSGLSAGLLGCLAEKGGAAWHTAKKSAPCRQLRRVPSCWLPGEVGPDGTIQGSGCSQQDRPEPEGSRPVSLEIVNVALVATLEHLPQVAVLPPRRLQIEEQILDLEPEVVKTMVGRRISGGRHRRGDALQ